MLVICVCLRLKPSAQSSEPQQVQGDVLALAQTRCHLSNKISKTNRPPTGKSTCFYFRLADHHTTFFPLLSVQLAAEAQPRKSALFGRGRQRQVQRPDSGGEQQPDREALRDLRLSGESAEEKKKTLRV